MQAIYQDWLLPVRFCPELQIYILREKATANKFMQQGVNALQIGAQKDKIPQNTEHQKCIRQNADKGHKIERYIFAQEMMYLTSIAEYPDYVNPSKPEERAEYSHHRERDIMQIYCNLTQKGYDCFDCIHFYLSVRKKSKMIRRSAKQASSRIFIIYGSAEDWKNTSGGQTVQVFKHKQPALLLMQNNVDKICICNNGDFVVMSIQ